MKRLSRSCLAIVSVRPVTRFVDGRYLSHAAWQPPFEGMVLRDRATDSLHVVVDEGAIDVDDLGRTMILVNQWRTATMPAPAFSYFRALVVPLEVSNPATDLGFVYDEAGGALLFPVNVWPVSR